MEKTTKCIFTFDNNHEVEFIDYLRNILIEDGSITLYEAYDEKKSEVWGYDENDFDVIVFLSDNFTLQSILKGAIEEYGEYLNVLLEYDEENPIECEDGEVIYQKYLHMYLA